MQGPSRSARSTSYPLPSLKLSSFTLEQSRAKSNKAIISHCTEGHYRRSLTAQAGVQSIHLLSGDQQLIQTLSLPQLLRAASNVAHSQIVLDDILASRDADIQAIVLQYDASLGETQLFVAIRSWVVVVVPLRSGASSSAASVWRVASTISSSSAKSAKNVKAGRQHGTNDALTLDVDGRHLLIGTQSSLLLWMRKAESSSLWTPVWRTSVPRPVAICRFCPAQGVFAVVLEKDRNVVLWSTSKPRRETATTPKPVRTTILRHSRSLIDIQWRGEPEKSSQGQVLVTRTDDGTTRVWAPVIDEPDSLRLISAIDSSDGWIGDSNSDQSSRSNFIYLDAAAFCSMLRSNIERLQRDLQMAELGIKSNSSIDASLELKRSRSRRLESILAETPDVLLRLGRCHSLELKAIANVDRRPPTLCGHFTVLKAEILEPNDIDERAAGNLFVIPHWAAPDQHCYDPAGHIIICDSNGRVRRAAISPALLLDGAIEGFREVRIPSPRQEPNIFENGFKAVVCSKTGSKNSADIVLLSRRQDQDISRNPEAIFCAKDSAVVDLTWAPLQCSLAMPLIAIASAYKVHVLQRRRRILKNTARYSIGTEKERENWRELACVDIGRLSVDAITSVSWLKNCELRVETREQLFTFSPQLEGDQAAKASISPLILSHNAFESAVFADYHPEALREMLYWGSIDTVQLIFKEIAKCSEIDVQIEEDLMAVQSISSLEPALSSPRMQEMLQQIVGESMREVQGRDLPIVDIDTSCIRTLPDEELSQVATLASIARQFDKQRHLLDNNAMRFLLEHRLCCCSIDTREGRSDLPWHLAQPIRHFVWAWHSNSQMQLVQSLSVGSSAVMDWQAARRCGVFVWLRSQETLEAFAEDVARAQFNSGDERDPTLCSLFYYALGKARVVANLWRQAIWHSDHKKMVHFLKNDFSEERWKSAALKNAFALLSQRRFEMAAGFFLLADRLSDAVNVCVRNLHDVHLALALCRLKEKSYHGAVMTRLVRDTIVPDAYQGGDRWTLSMNLDLLGKPRTAMRVVTGPLEDVVDELISMGVRIDKDVHDGSAARSDDASLVLLYKQLRQRPDYFRLGFSYDAERKLVQFACRSLRDSGHYKLAIAIASHWRFEPPSIYNSAHGESTSASIDKERSNPAHNLDTQAVDSTFTPPGKMSSLMKLDGGSMRKQAPEEDAAFDMGAFDF